MADAPASGAGVRKGVGVQVPPRAQRNPCSAGVGYQEDRSTEAAGADRVLQLVASRTLDAACIVALDRPPRTVRGPNAVTSIESFTAALVGRFLVLAAGIATAR